MKQIVFALFVAGIITTTGCSSKSNTVVIEAPESVTPTLTNDVHWFRNAAEKKAIYLQGFELATDQLEEKVRGMQPGTWAVSLDADETILDNSQYQKDLIMTGTSYSSDTWNVWCEQREAGALPGAKTFTERVKELGGKVVIVSNRYVETQEATEDNLKELGIPFDLVMLRQGSPDKQKERRWNEVESGTTPAGWQAMPIVMYLGDNIEDFPEIGQSIRNEDDSALSEIGKTYIMFPNPMYGSWMGNEMD